MEQNEEDFAVQLQEKQASANHEKNVLSSHAKRQGQGIFVMYKKKMNELDQSHAAKEAAVLAKLEKKNLE
eukprot:6797878-Prorocentrum_lima.AAC.1